MVGGTLNTLFTFWVADVYVRRWMRGRQGLRSGLRRSLLWSRVGIEGPGRVSELRRACMGGIFKIAVHVVFMG